MSSSRNFSLLFNYHLCLYELDCSFFQYRYIDIEEILYAKESDRNTMGWRIRNPQTKTIQIGEKNRDKKETPPN